MISKTITSFSIALLLFFVTLSASISVQGQTTTRYVYDENGRLHAVIAPSGEAARYRYDAAGNITEVERIEANVTTNLDFTPKVGAQTDLVEIVGTGFSPTPNANLVTFTGVTAQVREASLTRLVVEVPFGATTGPINVIAPNGASQSAVPFTIMPRLKMTPANVILPVSTEQQFTATPLSVDGNTAVTWMVNGVIGGNATVGTISTTGAYLSPPTPRTGIVIRALITAQPEIYGEAQVQVSTIGRFAYTALLVQRGESSPAAVFASQVTVRYGEDIGAVQSPLVSVEFGPKPGWINAAVSTVTGAYLSNVTPVDLSRGTSTIITLTGQSLTGTTALQFLLPSGQPDTALTFTNLQVNPSGTQLTAVISVANAAALDNRIVIVTTATGRSPTYDLGNNIIRVIP